MSYPFFSYSSSFHAFRRKNSHKPLSSFSHINIFHTLSEKMQNFFLPAPPIQPTRGRKTCVLNHYTYIYVRFSSFTLLFKSYNIAVITSNTTIYVILIIQPRLTGTKTNPIIIATPTSDPHMPPTRADTLCFTTEVSFSQLNTGTFRFINNPHTQENKISTAGLITIQIISSPEGLSAIIEVTTATTQNGANKIKFIRSFASKICLEVNGKLFISHHSLPSIETDVDVVFIMQNIVPMARGNIPTTSILIGNIANKLSMSIKKNETAIATARIGPIMVLDKYTVDAKYLLNSLLTRATIT